MSKGKNKYGLSRNIPPEVKKDIRNIYGNGCIICGNFFIDYHHFDPPFNEAREHNPLKIAPLCPHCHDEFHKKLLGDKEFNDAVANPFAIQNGIAKYRKRTYTGTMQLKMGADFAKNGVKTNWIMLRLDNTPILWAEYEDNGTVVLCANFFFGNDKLIINRNEIIIPNKAFEITTTNNVVFVKKKNNLVLKMTLDTNLLLSIDFLQYESKGYIVSVDGDTFNSTNKNGGGSFSLNNCGIGGGILLQSAPQVSYNPLTVEKYPVYDYKGNKSGFILLNVRSEQSTLMQNIIIDRNRIIGGEMKNWKCYNMANDFVGIYKNGYIVSNETEYPDGRPKFIRKVNLPRINDYKYEVSENILPELTAEQKGK